MLHKMTHWIAGTPARLVRSGVAGFLAGTAALLLVAVAQVTSESDVLPAWVVPDSSTALTAATLLVCWGVWAMGAGLRRTRERALPSHGRR